MSAINETEASARRDAIAAEIVARLAAAGVAARADGSSIWVSSTTIAWVRCETERYGRMLSGRIHVEVAGVDGADYRRVKLRRTVEATEASLPKIIATLIERQQLRAAVEEQRRQRGVAQDKQARINRERRARADELARLAPGVTVTPAGERFTVAITCDEEKARRVLQALAVLTEAR